MSPSLRYWLSHMCSLSHTWLSPMKSEIFYWYYFYALCTLYCIKYTYCLHFNPKSVFKNINKLCFPYIWRIFRFGFRYIFVIIICYRIVFLCSINFFFIFPSFIHIFVLFSIKVCCVCDKYSKAFQHALWAHLWDLEPQYSAIYWKITALHLI